MKRREFLAAAGAAALSMVVAKPALAQSATLRWWYHFARISQMAVLLPGLLRASNREFKDLHGERRPCLV
jgi:hypothetical protein